ncbi:hypothetical protein D1007_08326 [Hordeum vulgare]|nr:hypothetical protein D1007_08326 [Hordeum vulgare]
MASPLDSQSAMSGGSTTAAKPDLEDLFDQLDLNDEEFADVDIEGEDPEIQESVWWLGLARVHTEKNSSQSAFYNDMHAAWNPARSVSDAEDVVLVHMPIWLQIHKLSDPYCKENIMEKLLKGAREILEMRLNGNICGDYVRVRVNHDIRQPLMKFVSIVRVKERQVYLVRYEKLVRFCKMCGLVGHEHKECAGPRPLGRTKNPNAQVASEQEKLDPEILDTTSSHVKNLRAEMDVDKEVRKRLNMDAGTPAPLLAIADGSGMDVGMDKYPTSSSSSSKRLKLSKDSHKNEI